MAPMPIHFAEAIPIACLGLAVNVASALILSGGHHHGHEHGHGHGDGRQHGHSHGDAQDHEHHDEAHDIRTANGLVRLEVFEDGVPPRFRLRSGDEVLAADNTSIETIRPDGSRQTFKFIDRGNYLESIDKIPEPHEFEARVRIGEDEHAVRFEEHAHGSADRDHNMRAAVIHVMADAAVSVLVIAGLMLARAFGWLWMDPLAGIVGAFVIASWSFGLIRDTGGILLDMNPDRDMAEKLRLAIETEGDRLADLHLWRLGPGHLGAIVSITTEEDRGPDYYRGKLTRFRSLSHLTIEVQSI